MASGRTTHESARSSPPATQTAVISGCAPLPAHIRQVRGRYGFEGFSGAGSSRTPLRHACRARAVWQCQHAPALSGLLPPSPAPPGSGCPQLRRPAATGTAAVVSHLRSNRQRLTAHRMEPERLLPRRRCLLLLRARSHDGGVHIERDQPAAGPGADGPASAHARARAAERAARIAFKARGASVASRATSRDTTGSEATGPNSSGCARSTATSARQSPPSANATTRSVTIFPGHAPPALAATAPAQPKDPAPGPLTGPLPPAAARPPGTRSPIRQQRQRSWRGGR